MRSVEQLTAAAAGLLMRKSEVAKLLGCSDRQVENLVRSERIPAPIYLGKNSPRWRRPELLTALGFPADVRTDSGLMQ